MQFKRIKLDDLDPHAGWKMRIFFPGAVSSDRVFEATGERRKGQNGWGIYGMRDVLSGSVTWVPGWYLVSAVGV